MAPSRRSSYKTFLKEQGINSDPFDTTELESMGPPSVGPTITSCCSMQISLTRECGNPQSARVNISIDLLHSNSYGHSDTRQLENALLTALAMLPDTLQKKLQDHRLTCIIRVKPLNSL